MKAIINKVSLFSLLVFNTIGYAQTEGVSIKSNASAPHASAMLDIESLTKGLLIPRVSLSSTSNGSNPVANPATGLLVYNIANTANLNPGFYYWNGSAWAKVGQELWKVDQGNSNNIYYNAGTNNSTVVVGNGASGISTTSLQVFGSSRFFSSSGSATSPGPRDGIIIGDAYNAIGVNSAGNSGGHINEINAPNFPLELQFNTGQDVTIGNYGGSDLYVFNRSTTNKGNIYADGYIFSQQNLGTSDSTLKKNITLYQNVSEKIANCKTYSYHFKNEENSSTKHIGVIAQELELQFPQLVKTITKTKIVGNKFAANPTTNTQNIKTVDYSGLTAVLLQAIKEQQTQIESLKQRVTLLEQK